MERKNRKKKSSSKWFYTKLRLAWTHRHFPDTIQHVFTGKSRHKEISRETPMSWAANPARQPQQMWGKVSSRPTEARQPHPNGHTNSAVPFAARCEWTRGREQTNPCLLSCQTDRFAHQCLQNYTYGKARAQINFFITFEPLTERCTVQLCDLSYNHRLEKTSKIIQSNHPPNTTLPTKPCPEVPHVHVFLNTSKWIPNKLEKLRATLNKLCTLVATLCSHAQSSYKTVWDSWEKTILHSEKTEQAQTKGLLPTLLLMFFSTWLQLVTWTKRNEEQNTTPHSTHA